jgi:hypothetical protein
MTSRIPRSLRIWASFVLSCAAASAAPPLTTIQDTVYRADATPFTGTAYIRWNSFNASDNSAIGNAEIVVPIQNGQLTVKLVPTANAVGGAFYSVRYQADGKFQFSEIWSVPLSATPLNLAAVKVQSPGSATQAPDTGSIAMNAVIGLAQALADRVVKGVGFTQGRSAIIDSQGALAAASGSATDCLHVDGTSGPCGGATTFVDLEIPSGAVNSTNTTFTLAGTPSPVASLLLFRNGILQRATVDYTVTGTTITFLAASTPQSGDVIQVSYRK